MSKKDELINEMVELAEAQCIGGFNDLAYNRDLDYLLANYDIVPKNGALEKSSHENSGLNKPVVTVSLPLSNEQILKGIQTSPRYQLPEEWLKNEHTNSNYMGGFLNAVKWMEGNDR